MKRSPTFTEAQILDLESALEEEYEDWARLRLETLLTVAKEGNNLPLKDILDKHGISKATLYRWLKLFRINQVGTLLHRAYRRSEYSASRACLKFEIRILRSARIDAKLDMKKRMAKGEHYPWAKKMFDL
jgi:transposase-like protein